MIRMLRVLAVDDEQLALRRIELLLRRMPDAELVGTARSGPEAIGLVQTLAPDVLLLDIRMAGMSGLDVAATMQRETSPVVIFVTAFDRFAAAAFDLSVTDYVVKPVEAERLHRALDRARRHLEAMEKDSRVRELHTIVSDLRAEQNDASSPDKALWVQQRGEFVRLAIDDIDWVEAERDYMRLHSGAQSYLVRHTLARLQQRLGADRFLRIHRSALVRSDGVVSIRKAAYGDIRLKLCTGQELRVGRSHFAQFRALLT
jgi:DNA-binding LytR/AlgR family response regulator